MENALDAVAEAPSPRIELRVWAEGDRAYLRVRDNRPGIPEASLLRIFDPFFTTKPVGQGTGLGLWVSYGIAKDHGGNLEAASPPDGGAVFTMWLPRDPGPIEPHRRLARSVVSERNRKSR